MFQNKVYLYLGVEELGIPLMLDNNFHNEGKEICSFYHTCFIRLSVALFWKEM